MGADDRARRGDEAAGAPGRERRGEVLDAAALRADAGQQERRARHQLAQPREVLGRGRADDGADVARPVVAVARPSAATSAATRSQTVPPAASCEVLDVGGAGVRGAHEHEDAGAGGAGGRRGAGSSVSRPR